MNDICENETTLGGAGGCRVGGATPCPQEKLFQQTLFKKCEGAQRKIKRREDIDVGENTKC
ncbi:MAG: hypothetical protein DWQ58_14910 [Microcystis aeruginosa TA09]|nr:MAG: hypothetical protein DWQ58_14910 [Microcystis aeruginosa TA09]